MWLKGTAFLIGILLLIFVANDMTVKSDRIHALEMKLNIYEGECARNVKLGEKEQFPNVFLTSFPGSGNTWARTLLEDVTGYYTGSVYVDKSLAIKGLIGEYEEAGNGRTIGIKAHGMNGMAKQSAGVILLIRNPYDAMLSEFNRRESGNHTGNPDPALYDDPIFAKRITSYSGRYLELHKKYATGLYFNEHHPKLMTVYYEDLKDNLEQELTRVLEFLKKVIDFTPDDAEKRIKCSLQRAIVRKSFLREKTSNVKEYYSKEQIELVNRELDEINEVFLKEGIRQLPQNYYKNI